MLRLPRAWRRSIQAFGLAGCLFWGSRADAQTITVTNLNDTGAGSLRNAISTATAGETIAFTPGLSGTIALASPLPIISENLAITGAGANVTVSGANTFRVFFANNGNISISNLTVLAGNATGGAGGGSTSGGAGGGGGLGAGGGLFVNTTANVTLTNVVFQNNTAIGGTGGSSTGVPVANNGNFYAAGGGGGGLGGAGGSGSATGVGGGGGGGLYGAGASSTGTAGAGGGGQITNGGADGAQNGGGGGSVTTAGGVGTVLGGGHGGHPSGGNGGSIIPIMGVTHLDGRNGTYGGGGGGGAISGVGGGGGVNGGGGGAGNGAGGPGGDLGGGGGGAYPSVAGSSAIGGAGGYGGGGGGGAYGYASGAGGFGAGSGGQSFTTSGGGGGGGSGFGGAVFVRAGGAITVTDGQLPAGNTVVAGVGGTGTTTGATGAAGGGAFYLNNVNLNYSTTAGYASVIGNDIAGSGELFKNGSGALVLTAASTYTGPTYINAGTLQVDGSVTSAVTVQSGGTLIGTGAVGPTTVYGTIGAGDYDIGRLTVKGQYVQEAGSNFLAIINDNQRSTIVQVNGAASLFGGTVDVAAEPGTYSGGLRYTILSATNGVSGQFSDVTVTGLGRPAAIFYEGTKVLLVTQLLQSELIASALTFNQASVVNVLVDPNLPAKMQPVYNAILFQTQVQAQHDLDQLSGAMYPSLLSYSRTNALLNGNMLFDQLVGTLERPSGNVYPNPEDPQPSNWNAWLKFRGTEGANADARDASGLNSSSSGFLAGLDRWLGPTSRIGVYGGYSETMLNTQGLDESAIMDAYDIGVTGSQTLGPWYVLGFGGYAYNHYSTDRLISFSEFYNSLNSGSYGSNLANFGFEGGRAIDMGDFRLQPLAGFQYVNISNNGLTESGDGLTNLNVPGLSEQALWSSLGTRCLYSTYIDNMSFGARASVRYLHDFCGDATPLSVMDFAGGGTPFAVMGAKTGSNLIWSGLGLTFGYRETANVFIDMNVLSSTRQNIYTGSGGFEIRW